MTITNNKFRQLMDSLPDAFAYSRLVVDGEGNPADVIFLHINEAFEETFGLAKEDIIGQKATELLPELIKPELDWIGTFGQVALNGQKARFNSYFESLACWFEVTVYSEEPGFFAVIFRDISESKRDLDILHTSRSQLQTILNFLPDATFVIDLEGKVLVWNKAMEEMTGIREEDILGKGNYEHALAFYGYRRPGLVELALDPDPEIEKKYSWIVRNHDRSLVAEGFCPAVGESGIHVWAKASPIYDPRGKIIGAIESVRDVTQRKQAEEALRQSEQKYREILSTMEEGYYEVDLEGRITFCNDSLCRQLGYAEEELLQESYKKLSLDTEKVFQIFHRVYQTGQPEQLEWPAVTRAGRELLVEVSVSLRRDSAGQPLGFSGVTRDITERKQQEAEIRARNEELGTLYVLSSHMRTAKDSNELLPIVLDNVLHLLQADGGMISLLSTNRSSFTVTAAQGCWKESEGLAFPSEQGLSGIVMRTGQPYISQDYSEEPRYLNLSQEEQIGPVVFVPLQSEENLLGILAVARLKGAKTSLFTYGEIHLLTAIGEMAGNALRRQRLFESSQRRLQQLQAMHNIDSAVTANQELDATLEIALSQVTGLLHVDAAAVLLLDRNSRTLRYKAWHGFYAVCPGETVLRPGEGYGGRAVSLRAPVQIPDLSKTKNNPAQSQLIAGEGFAAYFAAPLVSKGQVNGVLEVFHRKPLYPEREWLDFLKALAGQVAIAVDNDRLLKDLEQANLELSLAYDATIEGWAYALDLRDEETEGHSQRVTEMTVMLANAIGMPEEKMLHVRRGAILHDIGKMGVPDSILLKPGKLTEKEWEIMHRHPQLAYEMLSHIEYLAPTLNIPYCHHEKWNGTGYPNGLQGKDIPLEARIFAVVDVFDALTSDRPYRPAWSREKAIEHICKESGKHFDPQVVDLFLKKIGNSFFV